MKKLLKIAILSLSVSAVNSFAAMPVVDYTAIAKAVQQAKNQVQQMENQVKQFKSMNGTGHLGTLLNDPATRKLLNQHLPNGYTDVYQAMQRNDLGALQSVYQGVIADEKAKRTAGNGKERLASTMLLGKAQTQAMMQSLNVRSNNIQTLSNQINAASDAKTKADLANRLMAEQSMISVDMNKMQVAMKINEQNEKLAERQIMSETRAKVMK